jgi:hypothetical protein
MSRRQQECFWLSFELAQDHWKSAHRKTHATSPLLPLYLRISARLPKEKLSAAQQYWQFLLQERWRSQVDE